LAERQSGKRRKFSLGAVLGGVFGLLIALAMGIVLGLSVYSNYTNTLGLLNGRSVSSVEVLEDNLDRDLGPARDIVDFLALLFADGVFGFEDRATAEAILRGASAGDPDVAAIILYSTKTGRRFGVSRGPADQYGPIDDQAVSNPMIQRELMDGAPLDKAVWGRPVIVGGSLFANVRRALVRNGTIYGYVVAAIPVSRVSARLSILRGTDNATAFIIDSNNRVLVHPSLSKSIAIEGARRDATGEAVLNLLAPRLALIEDPVLRRFGERNIMETFTEAAEKGVDISFLDRSGDDVDQHNSVFMTKKTSAFSAEPWTLGLYYPAYAVNEELRRLMLTMVAGLLVLVVTVIAAVLLGHWMAKPVKRITQLAGRVTALDLDNVERLPESRVREFDTGARAMNQMVNALTAFSTYVPKALVARLVSMGAEETGQPVEVDLTVMFTDIAGFTTRSETMGASDTAEFLNRHFAKLGAVIDDCGGTIDKYMGDGLMAFWGAPEPRKDHAARACEAARRIVTDIAEDNRRLIETGGQPVFMRIGIHTGPTIVGNIGAASRVNYTVVGDTVNISARLQELGKTADVGAEAVILISEQTRAEAGVEDQTLAFGRHHLRGREQEIGVYRLL
jgi:adenylate cyclase